MIFTWWGADSHNYTQNQQREPGQRHDAPLLLVPKQGALKLPVNALPFTILISASPYIVRGSIAWHGCGRGIPLSGDRTISVAGDEVWEPTSMYRNIQGLLNFAFSNEVTIENFKKSEANLSFFIIEVYKIELEFVFHDLLKDKKVHVFWFLVLFWEDIH